MDNTQIPKLLTTEEVSKMFNIPVSTIGDYGRRGVIPSIKIGYKRRFVPEDVAEWLRRKRDKSIEKSEELAVRKPELVEVGGKAYRL
ncbi:helix-turn-helix domain-containing protein [Candidatus Oleimmundimicrobium sp.]|uniref:helix-turn-helix domain-containing protein n=1 Tax=Candidatus Oleimmundimicrobium sp. TaxID=3060597 RepID=UPI0027268126|nr:helix-turn-helix domain-containing protein [Candidatus Oleimmundimicrobium sp.]MDO8886685.1 helix-turn-helix domain-containing protein [Candidatus Oleimmundimicrobium sp.]